MKKYIFLFFLLLIFPSIVFSVETYDVQKIQADNPKWVMEIESATQARLLRELVFMQACQLEIARKNNELLHSILKELKKNK